VPPNVSDSSLVWHRVSGGADVVGAGGVLASLTDADPPLEEPDEPDEPPDVAPLGAGEVEAGPVESPPDPPLDPQPLNTASAAAAARNTTSPRGLRPRGCWLRSRDG
jgi:hypothetical protein